MTTEADSRCPDIEPVWDRRCVETAGHDDLHRNDEVRGETLTWGTIAQVRAHERNDR